MKLGVGIIITALLLLRLVSGEIPTKSSPAPSPDLAADAADSPPLHAPTPELGSPPSANSPSPAESPTEYSSPPEPKTKHSPSPSPSPSDSPSISPPSPDDHTSPSPSPEASDLNHSDIKGIEEEKSSGGGGMSGGTKAGVAFGTIAAVCVVGLAGFVYKKRQENLRRSRYGYAAREIL